MKPKINAGLLILLLGFAQLSVIEASAQLPSPEVIGCTWYDLQTNASMQNRLCIFDDGTVGAVWTMGFDYSGFPDRGTGYNYFDGSAWGLPPDSTIEDARTGWPSIARIAPEGEVVVSHFNVNYVFGLSINKRAIRGTGTWETDTLSGPPNHESILWSRMVTAGNAFEKIHILALTYSPYNGQDRALLYYRSQDEGNTWDILHQLFPELNSDHYLGIPVDCYAWAKPASDTIAFIVASRTTDMVVMKSEDGGDNWEKTVVWAHPYPFFDNNTITTDTVFCCDKSSTIALDKQGKVHVAFGCGIMYHPYVGFWGLLPPQDGIGYWNEDMPVFPGTHDALKKDSLEVTGNLIAWAQDMDGNGVVEFLDEYLYYRSDGICSMPYLTIGDHDDIYLVYSGLAEWYSNSIYNFRHIWFRSSPDGGNSWGDFTNLNDDLIGSGFNEYVFPVLDYTNGQLSVICQKDTDPGLALDEDHFYTENSILYYDLNQYIIPPSGLEEVVEPSSFSLFPNPTSDFVFIHSEEEVSKISVMDLSGKVIYSETFQRKTSSGYNISLAEFTPGIYFIRADFEDSYALKKLVVSK